MNRDNIEPRKTFYMAITQGSTDGRLDITSEMPIVYGSLDEAVSGTEEEVDDHGMPTYVYECRPVRRIHRTNVIVETIE
jgi:hypothetical protein